MSKPQSSTFLKSRHHKIRLKPNNTHLTVTLNLFIKNLSNNKALLYSTGKYIQYPVIKHTKKEYDKEGRYICA